MKIRSDYVSNSSSSSFVVDRKTYDRYCEKYGDPDMSPVYQTIDGRECVEFYGWDSEQSVDGYDNDEEYVSSLYDEMCNLDPEFIEWSNNH